MSCYIAQAGPKLLDSSDSPAQASQVAETTEVNHHTHPKIGFKCILFHPLKYDHLIDMINNQGRQDDQHDHTININFYFFILSLQNP